ncbi:hypothetical protein D9611_013887 [Ephemerocybe angulata]|uniref:Uncharacterized protein n=1 Tax=Ephemerocybe angulata TaxID=980116 RepID=A0A8H5FAC0_9AGAR|nr:hypothetical protein D9611_013887 [Tulosesus angulatus]
MPKSDLQRGQLQP